VKTCKVFYSKISKELSLSGNLVEFSQLLRQTLLQDFDAAFDFFKKQKLASRSRSSDRMKKLISLVSEWLPTASLNGKNKHKIRRHLEVCLTFQRVFEAIDSEAERLAIWTVPQREMMISLFSEIERTRIENETVDYPQNSGTDSLYSGVKQRETFRRDLRNDCDHAALILQQSSKRSIRPAADEKLRREQVIEALNLAAVADLVMTMFDCYTYKDYWIDFEDHLLKMRARSTEIDKALEWSSLRNSSKESLDITQISHVIDDLVAKGRALALQDQSFEQFITSDQGELFWTKTDAIARFSEKRTTSEVEGLLDLGTRFTASKNEFTFQEIIFFWAQLNRLSFCAYIWNASREPPEAPVMLTNALVEFFARKLAIPSDKVRGLIQQFSLDPSKATQDPFYRPLIRLDQHSLLLACTFIETSRFSRNIFSIAIRDTDVNLSSKGIKPVLGIKSAFENARFEVRLSVPVWNGHTLVTDVDLTAFKDNTLFIAQIKVLIQPDTPYEEWKCLQSLQTGVRQLNDCLRHLPYLSQRLHLNQGTRVFPFLLTNIWDFTGMTIQGFKVVDFSYLANLLTGANFGMTRFGAGPRTYGASLIAGKYPTPEELERLLSKSVHERMFRPAELHNQELRVAGWRIIYPAEKVVTEALANREVIKLKKHSKREERGPAHDESRGVGE
jgi:hypothetical protein